MNEIIHGDSKEVLKTIESESTDALVCDPPYALGFMGKSWDKTLPDIGIFKECLRVLKPGAFAFVMSAPRSDVCARMMLLLEDAGFEIGFTPIYWTYASGFPKAMNIGKMVDKRMGAERPVVRTSRQLIKNSMREMEGRDDRLPDTFNYTAPATPEAKSLDGSYGGFQPKPAVEVVIVAMKPLSEKTFVDQALKNGKGITWLDKCRIPLQGSDQDDSICTCQCDHSKCDAPSAAKISGQREATKKEKQMSSVPANVATPFSEKILGILPEDTSKIITSCSEETSGGNTTISLNTSGSGKKKTAQSQKDTKSTTETTTNETTASKTCSCSLHTTIEKSTTEGTRNGGRFPANILVSDDVLNDGATIRAQKSKRGTGGFAGGIYQGGEVESYERGFSDSGSYSRYFSLDAWASKLPESVQKTFPFLIVPKASKGEKNTGLTNEPKSNQEREGRRGQNNSDTRPDGSERQPTRHANNHPTVKPLQLMSYLITLGSREGDIILDPFVGSGTTCIAAKMLNRKYIGIEREKEYAEIAEARLKAVPDTLFTPTIKQ